jgi:hypothetical protein
VDDNVITALYAANLMFAESPSIVRTSQLFSWTIPLRFSLPEPKFTNTFSEQFSMPPGMAETPETNSDLVVRATWFANPSLLYAKAIVTHQQKYGGE